MQHKPAAATLDFKITSLGEIKSRKAKAEVAEARGAALREAQKAGVKPQSGKGLATVKGNSFEEATNVAFTTVAKEVPTPAPTPAPVPAVPVDPPQLDAEDMDEFSEWL